MKATLAKDLVIGAIYSDIKDLNELATLLKFTGRSNGFSHFDYYGGADYYGHDDGGSYARFATNPIFYELSPLRDRTVFTKGETMNRKETKYYFRTIDAEGCYELDYHFNDARNEWLDEIELYEAIPDIIPGNFWCMEFSSIGEDGDCGKQCAEYDPINGKSGKCRSKGKFYTHGEKLTFAVPKLIYK